MSSEDTVDNKKVSFVIDSDEDSRYKVAKIHNFFKTKKNFHHLLEEQKKVELQ